MVACINKENKGKYNKNKYREHYFRFIFIAVHNGWGSEFPWKKYVGGVRVCFDPLKYYILSFKTVVV